MFCQNCGNEIDDDSRYCNYCGAENKKIRSVSSDNYWDKKNNANIVVSDKGINDLENNSNTLFRKMGISLVVFIIFIFIAALLGGGAGFSSDYENYDMGKNEALRDKKNNQGYELDESILGPTLYQNYSADTDISDIKKPEEIQIEDMIFNKQMTFDETVQILANNGYHTTADRDMLITDGEVREFTYSNNAVDYFKISFTPEDDVTTKLGDCVIHYICVCENSPCKWYNSYGIGAYGEGIPDYYSFIEELQKNNVDYSESSKDGKLAVILKRKNYYYDDALECEVLFDRSSYECVSTKWDKGLSLFKP